MTEHFTREVLEQTIPNEVVRSALHATGDGPFSQTDYDDMRASLKAAFLGMQQVADRAALAHPTLSTTAVGMREEFVRAINFAITQGSDASEFLNAWLHGDTNEWPEFTLAQGEMHNDNCVRTLSEEIK